MKQRSSALKRPSPRQSDHENVISEVEKPLASPPATSDTLTAADASRLTAQPKKGTKMSDTTQAGEKRERRQNLTYTYRDKDGQEGEKFSDDSRSVIFMLDATGKKAELKLAQVIKDQNVIDWLAENAPVALRGALFGFKTTVGNAVTSVKSGSAEEMLQAIEQRIETLVEGEWREGGERGPSPKLVLEALISHYTTLRGKAPAEDRVKAFRDLIRKEGTKQVLTNADVLAEFEAVKLREQQKKVDEARKLAQAQPDTGTSPSAIGTLLAD